jgi:hypothetical protein
MKKLFIAFITIFLANSMSAQSSLKMKNDFVIKPTAGQTYTTFSGATIECENLIIDKGLLEIKLERNLTIICADVQFEAGAANAAIKISGGNFTLTIDVKSGNTPASRNFAVYPGSAAKYILASHH